MQKSDVTRDRIILGWREWVSLPELGIEHIKAKVDTGARSSCLHAFKVDTFEEKGMLKLRFFIHPLQKSEDVQIECVADVVDRRVVTDSGGHKELRYVICTPVKIGSRQWPIELTLTNRDNMLFRMLLGRTAMRNNIIVDPSASFLIGKSRGK